MKRVIYSILQILSFHVLQQGIVRTFDLSALLQLQIDKLCCIKQKSQKLIMQINDLFVFYHFIITITIMPNSFVVTML